MKHDNFARALMVCALLTFTLGCSQERSNAAAVAGRDGDCERLKGRICAAVGEKAPSCEAAELILSASTENACAQNLAKFASVQEKLTALREHCTKLNAEVCSKAGEDSEICSAVKEQSGALSGTECGKLLSNTDRIIEELERENLSRKPLDEKNQAVIAASDAPSLGPADAKVTVVEFSDFQCPFCARAARVIPKLRRKYPDDVRVVFRQFPLPNHNDANPAAQAALAAHAQGRFWEYHDLLFRNQNSLDYDSLLKYAEMAKLDVVKFKKDLDDAVHANTVLSDRVMGANIGVKATPTMYVNGKKVRDAGNLGAVTNLIDAALGGS